MINDKDFYDYIKTDFKNNIVIEKDIDIPEYNLLTINDYNEREDYLKELTKNNLKRERENESETFDRIEYVLGEGNFEKGLEEFKIMKREEEEERNFTFPNVKCDNDIICSNINPNLVCKDNLCITSKETISTPCNKNNECFSNYCKKYNVLENKDKSNIKEQKTYGYCRKNPKPSTVKKKTDNIYINPLLFS